MRGALGIQLPGESDLFRRRYNRDLYRMRRIRSIRLRGGHIALAISLMVALGLLVWHLTGSLLSWSFLDIHQFRLLGLPPHSSQQIQQVVMKYRGNILAVDLGALRQELRRVPEVRDVGISRKLPDRVEISFLLRKPCLQFKSATGYTIMDAEGVSLYTQSHPASSLMEVSAQDDASARSVLPYLDELKSLGGRVRQVGRTKPYGIWLTLKGHSEVFYPGQECFRERVDMYLTLKERLAVELNGVKSVDLRIPDRMYVEFSPSEESL